MPTRARRRPPRPSVRANLSICADTPSPSLLKYLLKGEEDAAEWQGSRRRLNVQRSPSRRDRPMGGRGGLPNAVQRSFGSDGSVQARRKTHAPTRTDCPQRDCHSTDTPSPSPLKYRLKVERGAVEWGLTAPKPRCTKGRACPAWGRLAPGVSAVRVAAQPKRWHMGSIRRRLIIYLIACLPRHRASPRRTASPSCSLWPVHSLKFGRALVGPCAPAKCGAGIAAKWKAIGVVSRRRDCHVAGTPSPLLLIHPLKGEGGAAE